MHHVNLDKLDNSFENLFICKDNKQHKNLHYQLEKVAAELVKKGVIKFSRKKGYYV